MTPTGGEVPAPEGTPTEGGVNVTSGVSALTSGACGTSSTTGASGASGPAVGSVDTILCLFCRASIHFVGLPAFRYADHLFKEHNILFDKEAVIDRTLRQQVQGYRSELADFGGSAPKKLMLEASVQVDLAPTLTDRPLTKIPIKAEQVSSEIEAEGTDIKALDSVALRSLDTREQSSRRKEQGTIAWYSGCEYECQICGDVFYYTEELRKHILSHCKISEYLDRYEKFETKTVLYTCNLCSRDVKRNFSAIKGHLQENHPGMTLLSYETKYELTDYRVERDVFDPPIQLKKKSEAVADANKEVSKRQSEPVPNEEKSEATEASPCKRTRFGSDASNDPEDTLDEKDLWYNGCEYQCQECQKMFYSAKNLLLHAGNDHELAPKQYQKKFGRFETRTSLYTCQMCQESVQRQKRAIENHLKAMHDMRLSDYADIFHPSAKKLLIKAVRCDDENRTPTGCSKEAYSYQEFVDGKCLFKCHICSNFTASESEKMWLHIRDLHNMDKVNYKKLYGDPCLKRVTLQCPICFQDVRFEAGSLKRHAHDAHSQSLTQYHESNFAPNAANNSAQEESGNGVDVVGLFTRANSAEREVILRQWSDKCVYRCSLCGDSFPSNSVLCNHLRSKHFESATSYKEKFGPLLTETILHTCLICHKQVMHRYGAIKSHLELHGHKAIEEYFVQYVASTLTVLPAPTASSQDTRTATEGESPRSASPRAAQGQSQIAAEGESFADWCEQCEFKCLECHTMFRSYNKLRSHLVSHNISPAEYKSKFSSETFMTRAVKHSCAVCAKTFSHTKIILSRHFREHDIDIYNYYVRYISGPNQPCSMMQEQTVPPSQPEKLLPRKISGPRNGPETKNVNKLNPDVARWANRCRYDCQICFVEHTTSLELKGHVTSQHSMSFLAYKVKFTNLASKVVIHRCRICQAKVYWSAKCLGTHLKTTHSTTLEQYYHAQISSPPPSGPPLRQLDLHPEETQPVEQAIQPLLSPSSVLAAANSDQQRPSLPASSFVRWKNQCNYDCQICGKEFKDYALLKPHIIKGHRTTIDEYRAQFGRCITNAVRHQCKICDRFIQHAHDSLAHHTRVRHNMSCTEYYESYIVGSEGGDPIPESHEILVEPTIAYENVAYDETAEGFLPDAPSLPVTNFMSSYPETGFTPFAPSKPVNFYTKWKNQCKYDCQICQEPFTDYKAFRTHIQGQHKVTVEGYKQIYGSTMTEAVNHPCQICGKEIRHNENNLNQHITSAHKMTLSQYYQTHIETNERNMGSSAVSQMPKPTPNEPSLASPDPVRATATPNELTPIQKWRNRCLFLCKVCNFTTAMKQDYDRHLKRSHNLDRHQYSVKHGDPMVERHYTNCVLCQVRLLHEYNVIRCHLREKHALSISDYFEGYIHGTQHEDAYEEGGGEDNPYLDEEESNDTILTDTSMVATHPDAWMNESIFHCGLCESRFKSKLRFNDHVAMEHNMVYDDYEAMYGDPTTMAMSSFTCKICGEMTFHNDEQITDHLSIRHGILPSTYYEEFVAKEFVVDDDGAPQH